MSLQVEKLEKNNNNSINEKRITYVINSFKQKYSQA